MMKCPQCGNRVTSVDVAKSRCPSCDTKIYFSPRHRWLRGISCALVTILITYRWYPIEHLTLTGHFAWLAVTFFVFITVFITSVNLIPFDIEQVPTDGPVRLDL